jgi:hypothetical protein
MCVDGDGDTMRGPPPAATAPRAFPDRPPRADPGRLQGNHLATILAPVAPKISAAFELVGGDGFSPHDLSTETGLTASRSWRVGDAGQHGRIRKNSYWSLRVGPDESYDLPAQVESLLDQVEPHANAILGALSRGGVTARIGLWWDIPDGEATPYLHFPSELLARIVHLGAGLDLDI